MKRIEPDKAYRGMPCSMVAVGCAMGEQGTRMALQDELRSPDLQSDGYLPLDGLNRLIRAHMTVKKRENFKRGQRPALRDFAHAHLGQRAVVCVLGHYLYFDGRDYHSFFWNGGDPVVSAWYLE